MFFRKPRSLAFPFPYNCGFIFVSTRILVQCRVKRPTKQNIPFPSRWIFKISYVKFIQSSSIYYGSFCGTSSIHKSFLYMQYKCTKECPRIIIFIRNIMLNAYVEENLKRTLKFDKFTVWKDLSEMVSTSSFSFWKETVFVYSRTLFLNTVSAKPFLQH